MQPKSTQVSDETVDRVSDETADLKWNYLSLMYTNPFRSLVAALSKVHRALTCFKIIQESVIFKVTSLLLWYFPLGLAFNCMSVPPNDNSMRQSWENQPAKCWFPQKVNRRRSQINLQLRQRLSSEYIGKYSRTWIHINVYYHPI